MQITEYQKRTGAILSLTIGGITGLLAIIFGILLPPALSGEGLFDLIYFLTTGYATLFLYVSFLITIWFAGKLIASDIIKGYKLIKISWKYSLIVNSIIWPVFIITSFINNFLINSNTPSTGLEYSIFAIILPLVLFVVSVIGTPYTVGLLICHMIKNRLNNKNGHNLAL